MKQWWRRWTYEVPLAIGDALWEVLVVQLAALLDRLTVRKVIAFIPVVILIGAYYHSIPIPPELMLIGDFLAYIDIFSCCSWSACSAASAPSCSSSNKRRHGSRRSLATLQLGYSVWISGIGASAALRRGRAAGLTNPMMIALLAARGGRSHWLDKWPS